MPKKIIIRSPEAWTTTICAWKRFKVNQQGELHLVKEKKFTFDPAQVYIKCYATKATTTVAVLEILLLN